MSNRYKGGVISATPPTTTGGESGTASGAWTLEQQMQLQAAGLWPAQPTGPWIEDCFSTWLVTGDGSAPAINNGIDLAGKGGMVWIKRRSGAGSHNLFDTARGANLRLISNDTAAQDSKNLSFTSTGFSNYTFDSGVTEVSWTFREQPKFFDVVTWTGDASGNRTLNHNLASTPGCIIIKATNAVDDWYVYHTSLGTSKFLYLNTTSTEQTASVVTAVSSTTFTVSQSNGFNTSGRTYVAYVYASNAGGFGLTGTDNVISCGSFTGTDFVNLGYEPQWILTKSANDSADWFLYDTMRGMQANGGFVELNPNNSAAEGSFLSSNGIAPTATGFQPGDFLYSSGKTYIYIAIRRGPMKVPTTGTSVFSPYVATTPGQAVVTTGFPVDFQMQKNAGAGTDMRFVDRLRGVSSTPTSPSAAFPFLVPSGTTAESTGTGTTLNWNNTGFTVGSTYESSARAWAVNFRRAPGFMDVCCYTGTGSARTQAHNLQAVPELIIVKVRNDSESWQVYSAETGNTRSMSLNNSNAAVVLNNWNNTTPTASVFSLGTFNAVNGGGLTYVAYLFASCPGVSKVGSYTGTGSTQVINCGFTGGARFVLIKRTDSAGDWYVWDTARGMIPSNDPYLLMNSTAAEVTGTDFVDTASTGFEITSTAPAAINASGGTFIFLAIA